MSGLECILRTGRNSWSRQNLISKGCKRVITAKLRGIGSNQEIRGEVTKAGSERTHPWFVATCLCAPEMCQKLNASIFCIAT